MAHEYSCTDGSATRKIAVVHEEGEELPCQVRYSKPDQKIIEYPWRAETTRGFCKEKAELLVSRLENGGWRCERTD